MRIGRIAIRLGSRLWCHRPHRHRLGSRLWCGLRASRRRPSSRG